MKEVLMYDVKEFKNIKEMFENSGREFAERDAFIIKHKDGKKASYEHITYEKFAREINCLGTALLNKGYKDKKIAIIGKNRYEWVLAYATIVSGVGIAVPLDKGLPDEEIVMSLKKSKAEVIFCEEAYLDTIKQIMVNDDTCLKKIICMDNVDRMTGIKELVENGEELIENGERSFIDAEIDIDSIASIVFTSGTTALSKAVMLTQRNIISNINDMNKVERMYETDTNIAFLPFHHTFGSTGILLFLSKGTRNVFCDGLRHVQENLKEYKVSVFVCVPLLLESMYKKIMAGIDKKGKTKTVKFALAISNFLLKFGIDVRRKLFKDILDELGGELRFIVSGASPLDKKVAKAFNDFGILTIQGYGLTEASPVVAAESINVIRYGSIGYPLPSVELEIFEPNEDGIGEIITKGPNIMLGYYEDEEATKEVLIDRLVSHR